MYKVTVSRLDGCLELIPSAFTDHRGISIKPFHIDAFKHMGIDFQYKEDLVVTSYKGVLRGLHLQKPPFQQAKLIYCVTGSVFDVAIDLRKNSPTYGDFVSFEIKANKHNMVYIPSGFAHGYQALEENTTVIYKLSSIYQPSYESGILWDSVGIDWPIAKPILSEKDKALPSLEEFTRMF